MQKSEAAVRARSVADPARALCRVAAIAAVLLLGACGGGGPAPASEGAASPRASAVSVVKTIDAGTMDRVTRHFVAGSANGDGIVMWLTEEGPRRQLWAVRYRAVTGQWSEPQRISRNNVYYYTIALTADAAGNAMAVWSEEEDGIVAARFDAAAGAWAAPVVLGPNAGDTPVAGNDAGVVHVIGIAGDDHVFDPAAGVWRSSGRFLQTNVTVGAPSAVALAVDQAGHAVGLYRYASDFELMGSNAFSPSTGQWNTLSPDSGQDFIGEVPGSRLDAIRTRESIVQTELAAIGQGDFIGVWNVDIGSDEIARIVLAKFSGQSRSWSTARTIVQVDPAEARLGTVQLRSGGGNTFAIWRQNLAGRPAVRVLRLDGNGLACDDLRTVDSAVGGSAEWPELVVDSRGNAFAAWHQNDGMRNNIAFSRFDASRGSWLPAELAETEPADSFAARPAIAGSQVLLTWVQREGDRLRIKATLLPTVVPPSP